MVQPYPTAMAHPWPTAMAQPAHIRASTHLQPDFRPRDQAAAMIHEAMAKAGSAGALHRTDDDLVQVWSDFSH